MFAKLSCTLALLLEMLWENCIRLTGKANDEHHQWKAQCKTLIPSDSIRISPPGFAAISEQKLPKTLLRGPGFPPLAGVVISVILCSLVHLVTRTRGMPFPGVQPILGLHPQPHEYLKSGSGTAGWSVSYSGKQRLMDHLFCLSPFHKQTQDASLIYLFLECMPTRESTADCIVQQFSRILQSHFISFSSLNPMTWPSWLS